MNPSESVIEFTYGKNADLYADVLKIESDAKPNDIKAAFFDRRAELYEEISSKDKDALTASERQFCEKKMDAIVLAFRILHNRETRRRYDNMLRKGKYKLNQSDSRAFSDTHVVGKEKLNKSFPSNYQQKTQATIVTPEKQRSSDHILSLEDDGTVSTMGMRGVEGSPAQKGKLSTSFNPNFEGTLEKPSYTPYTKKRTKSKLLNGSADNDDRSIQSDANSSVNSDVLMSREREKAKNMPRWEEETDEDDDTASYLSERTDGTYGSDTTHATANTAGSAAASSYNTYDTNDDTASYEDVGSIPLKSTKRKARKENQSRDLNETMDIIDTDDTGCFALSQKEKRKLRYAMAKGTNCLELISGENGLPNPTRMFHVISDEVSGSLTDTVKAIDQVLTAFNLNEYDIDAVGDNIGDATDNLCHS